MSHKFTFIIFDTSREIITHNGKTTLVKTQSFVAFEILILPAITCCKTMSVKEILLKGEENKDVVKER